MIQITKKIKNAINSFVGKDIIEERHVGREFFIGSTCDGQIGIDTYSTSKDCAITLTHFLDNTGKVRFVKHQNPKIYITEGSITYKPCHIGTHIIGTDASFTKTIDPHKANVVIGALYGFAEAQVTPSEAMLLEASLLRMDMSFEGSTQNPLTLDLIL